MPLDKLILLLIIVITAAAGTVFVASYLLASFTVPGLSFLLIPILLIAYIITRVIRDRVTNKQDDYYDNIGK